MSQKPVRTRFAPSPTGGLHLGGVRTALYNYLFARQHGGTFVLRIEDTDQTRFVPGAEQYIQDCLAWCGIVPDESPLKEGAFGPYRQSERKPLYGDYARQLVREGHAYYAFDTPEELEAKRAVVPNFQYGLQTRMQMRNSLTLPETEVQKLLAEKAPHVIRIRMPEDKIVRFDDLIRGEVSFETALVDDKVLLKADGMPTYHLAVVVDDYLMQITHAFRGEEWLPSAPVHLLLWEYLGWKNAMPQWAHLPLILKPDGNGKLSKRDGDRLGFPVYAMNWTDPKTGDLTRGFRELGFLPEAFVNLLALIGWNDGSDKELFSLPELVQAFSLERVNKSGAKFDYEKAKWFNAEWIKALAADELAGSIRKILDEKGVQDVEQPFLDHIISLVRDRLVLLSDFWAQAGFFFRAPETYDLDSIRGKWNESKTSFFRSFAADIPALDDAVFTPENLESLFKERASAAGLKPGEVMLPFRIMLVGGKFGPGVFDIAVLLGRDESASRISTVLQKL
ncbi:MAG: glutamate--tRNA ligase [Mucilaginibacter polytrichastri]|nr:glutamate--tRNA ligase [Mucilaginibacter polytrichastri]